jgi:hypothetical protein
MAQRVSVELEDDLDGGPADEKLRFGLVTISPAGTPRGREIRCGLPADAGAFLGLEPAG